MSQKVIFWRKPVELYSVISLTILAIINFVFARTSDSGLRVLVALSPVIITLALYRFYQYVKHVNLQAKLVQHPACEDTYEGVRALKKAHNAEDQIFLGYAFDWQHSHAQSLRELLSRDQEDWEPPHWIKTVRNKLGLTNQRDMNGTAYFHGLGLHEEKPLIVKPGIFGAHTFIGGTTGSGKSTMYKLLLEQFISRGESVIILDPKGDAEVRNAAYGVLLDKGLSHKYHFFSPSHYASSVRINLLKNFTTANHIAERIASCLPAGGNSETFKQFVHRHIFVLTDAILYAGDSPTLKAYLYYCSGGVHSLSAKVLEQFFEINSSLYPEWRGDAKVLTGRKMRDLHVDHVHGRSLALIEIYNTKIEDRHKEQVVNSLIDVAMKDKAHYDKLIGSLMPLLQKLATGKLGDLLSPDYDCPLDGRPIIDINQIIQKGEVLYVNLESMADGSTGSDLASMFISDIVAAAAHTYTHGKPMVVNLFCDEMAEQINPPFVQGLNKGRGAGMRVFGATQTLSDVTVKMGSQAHTDMVTGNTNNKFYLRLKDKATRDVATEDMGETSIKSRDVNKSTAGYSPGENMDFGGGYGNRESSKFEGKLPAGEFSRLPDLEFFAALSTGHIKKVRMPYIKLPDRYKFNPVDHQFKTPYSY